MLVSISFGVSEQLGKMGVMAVLSGCSFDTTLAYMDYCRSRKIDWPRCTSSWLLYDFSMGQVSDVSSSRSFLTRLGNADGEPLDDLILPALPVLFEPGEFTTLPVIQACVRRWMPEYHPSEVPGSERKSEIPGVSYFDP